MQRYLSLGSYTKEKFGTKLYKLALDGGFTCPNRDGTLGTRGCIFCSGRGSGDFAESTAEGVAAAIERAKGRVAHKNRGGGYIAYFQSYTATYAPIEKLEALFAEIFGTQSALVRPQIASGTHALGLALYGMLRRGDKLISVSGSPYDTLEEIIGASVRSEGSLCDIGVEYSQIELLNGGLDFEAIRSAAAEKPRMMMLQRSRGYADRKSIPVADMAKAFEIIKSVSPDTVIMTDNCYGEFVDTVEPTQIGADIAVGSLIKNIGGGIAPTGGYIVGSSESIQRISCRLTTPGIGGEVGSYAAGYLPFFQGLYLAPGAVAEALKGAVFAAAVADSLTLCPAAFSRL